MKKYLSVFIFFLIIFIPFWLFVIWFLWPSKNLDIFILDKTVLNKKCQEHRSLNWVLTNLKIKNYYDRFYKIDNDYFGFFPNDNKTYQIKDLNALDKEQIEFIANQYDMAYFADSYGVYQKEWNSGNFETEQSGLIYGGMSKNDIEFLFDMKEKGKTVILEFNTLASPTRWRVRKAVQDSFSISWSGWSGRYFDSLDSLKNSELPKWIIKNYKKQYRENWNYKKAGIIFVHISDKIVVLENGFDLNYESPIIYTSKKYRKEYDLPKNINYPFWFDITYPRNDSMEVVSNYKIFITERGDSILTKNKIPKYFPAVIHNKKSDNFYYFSGDFADNDTYRLLSYTKGLDYVFRTFLYNPGLVMNRKKFFWKYYSPLMKKIIHNELKKRELRARNKN